MASPTISTTLPQAVTFTIEGLSKSGTIRYIGKDESNAVTYWVTYSDGSGVRGFWFKDTDLSIVS